MNAERDARAFAERLAAACSGALGDQLVAAVLHGSLTLDDFVPGRSDIDLLVVVERPLEDGELGALRQAVEALGDSVPSRVDLRVVTRGVAASPNSAPAMEAYFELEPGAPPVVETRVAAEPDLAVELSMVRAHGRSLVGPDARSLIGDVPDEWVMEIGNRQLAAWERLTDDAAHDVLMVLTTCRIWRFGVEGMHCSKSEAGRWALARLAQDPSQAAVAAALRKRGGGTNETIGADEIGRLIGVVREAVGTRRR